MHLNLFDSFDDECQTFEEGVFSNLHRFLDKLAPSDRQDMLRELAVKYVNHEDFRRFLEIEEFKKGIRVIVDKYTRRLPNPNDDDENIY